MRSSPISTDSPPRTVLTLTALFCAGFLTFLPAIMNGGFTYDDRMHIVQNLTLRAHDGWRSIATEPVFPGSLYRPVPFLTYWIQAQLSGVFASHFLLFNSVIHGLNVVLVYLTILACTRAKSLGLTTAVLFAVHPIHVEAVANGVGRAELFAFFFGLLGCLLSLKRLYLIGSMSFLLAALSKESGLLFPLLSLLLHYSSQRKIALRFWLLSGATCGVFLSLRYAVLGALTQNHDIPFIDNPLATLPTAQRILKALSLLGRYIALHVIPYPQSADYSFATITPTIDPLFEPLTIFLVTVLFLCSCYLFLQRNVFGTGLLWFFFGFLITGNILFPIGTSFAERLAYTPSLGICLAIAAVLTRPFFGRTLLTALSCVLFLLFSLQYQKAWSSDKALFSRQVHLFPESVRMLVNMSVLEWSDGNFDGAHSLIKRALDIYPNSGDAFMVLGAIQAAEGEEELAHQSLQRALELQPGHLAAMNMLGRLSIRKQDFVGARKYIESGLRISSHHESLLVAKYLLEVAEGRIQKAKEVERALSRLKSQDREFIAIRDTIRALESKELSK